MLELFLKYPLFFYIELALLGLAIGSFLNVVIVRLPMMLEKSWRTDCEAYLADVNDLEPPPEDNEASFNLVTPRSQCPQCKTMIPWYQNIPVFSYLFLRGRCAHCQTSIPFRYPFVELLTAVLTVIVAQYFGVTWQTGAALIFTWCLIALTFIDLDHQLLPDSITLPLLWLGLLLNSTALFVPLHEAVWGAIIGYGSLWFIMKAYQLLTGKEGMGHGDFKLFAVLGAWLGWQALPWILMMSAVSGAVIGLVYLACRREDYQTPIPFGPFLAISGWISLLFGDQIMAKYWHLFVGM